MKEEAKSYYDKYKQIKKQFKQDRIALKHSNKELENEVNLNIKENERVLDNLNNVNNEISLFKKKVGFKSQAQLELENDADAGLIIELLTAVDSDTLFKNLDLDANEKVFLNEILKGNGTTDKVFKDKNNSSNNNNHERENLNESEERQLKVDEENNLIIEKIEELVNDNFSQGKIINIKINQSDDYVYDFNGVEALLFMDGNTLMGKISNIIIQFS